MNELGNTPADKNYKPSGTTKAQEAALKAFPGQPFIHDRCVFRMGYEQAEKDLALTWEDIRKIVVLFSEVSFECFDTKPANEVCEETLTRFKQFKEGNNDQD